ncbi:hypothetical protein GCM10009642_03580 [Nocardiopsis metallicus]|uniref:Peptidase S33 tripeptidyl aminopeptidase-like C-terminal domain-containing protein n=1 Tax=Nocardiopsis metallicus TaxID=179819 RepID=A0A840WNB0_9ACTN|nr:hypothetical protein [Nocardiopsis metallicus]
MVSITGDPTTPHGGEIELAETLGGALLTVEGEGRGIVSLGTNACVDEIAAAILSARAPMDVPTGFSSVAGCLSEADRAVLSISAMFDDDQAMKDLKSMIEAEPADLDHEINTLPPDASESTRQRLAERVAVILAEHQRNHPWMKDPEPHPTKSPAMVAEIAMRSIADLCNEAQRDVLHRAHILLRAPDSCGPPTPRGSRVRTRWIVCRLCSPLPQTRRPERTRHGYREVRAGTWTPGPSSRSSRTWRSSEPRTPKTGRCRS